MTKVAKILLRKCIGVAMLFIQAVISYSMIPFRTGKLLSPTPFHALLHVQAALLLNIHTGFELWDTTALHVFASAVPVLSATIVSTKASASPLLEKDLDAGS